MCLRFLNNCFRFYYNYVILKYIKDICFRFSHNSSNFYSYNLIITLSYEIFRDSKKSQEKYLFKYIIVYYYASRSIAIFSRLEFALRIRSSRSDCTIQTITYMQLDGGTYIMQREI